MDTTELIQFMVYLVIDERFVVVRSVVLHHIVHSADVQLVYNFNSVKINDYPTTGTGTKIGECRTDRVGI